MIKLFEQFIEENSEWEASIRKDVKMKEDLKQYVTNFINKDKNDIIVGISYEK